MVDLSPECPICGYTDCSLSHERERFAPSLLIFAARVVSRVCALTAIAIFLGLAMGWSW